ncbi:MAG TPA: SpoIIE family protein phosphatase [Methanothrix sp.]|nr:SpoIIE family protein phosphatase [Methanothrix sp.]HPJ83549.1 SpoIIE family protein phosphatase [Methanothrix sp.]HPR66213.1 SpoIIE family protein phosphatase [Methanothrix sp.]
MSGALLLALIDKICVIVVAAYLITRTSRFSEVLDGKLTAKNQAALVLIFGAFSVFGTVSGVEIAGVIANVRDLGPMIGGLVGGPLVGLGAGLIGGGYRYILGGFTGLPCSIATVLAGAFGGAVYLLNRQRFVGIRGAVIFSVFVESFHMLLVLLISDPYSEALMVVRETGIPMIASNAIGMLIFAFMISNLIKERETKEERDEYLAELERKKTELNIAREIQESFLPETVPPLKGFDLAAKSLPAKEVGGDFYDFIPISKDEMGLVIADVSGKSVPAALFMVLSRAMVKASAAKNPSVSEVAKRANDLIAADAKSGMFVTLFYAILDQKARTLRYVNAGHNPPLVLNGETGNLTLLKTRGIAMGVMDDAEMEEREIGIGEGDLVVFYTDGVTEASDDGFYQFGVERLVETVKKNSHLSAAGLVEKITGEVLAFSKGAPQFDDITLMVLKGERTR